MNKFDTKNKSFVSKTLRDKKVFDMVTVGSGVVDTFLELDIDEKNKQICVPAGAKLLVKKTWFSTGGGGTNTAVGFSRLGLKTGFIGKIGKDYNGKLILDELKIEKVSFLGNEGKEPTGNSVILDTHESNRTVLTFKGANSFLRDGDYDLKNLKTSWIYFASMIDESLKAQDKIADWALRRGVKTAYNPSSYVIKNNRKNVLKILKNLDVLILNNDEAFDLVGSGDVFSKIHSLGPKVICITYGEKGNKVSDGFRILTSLPNKIKIIERTGAGDSFSCGFVSGFIRFNDIEKAMKIGSANAESVIQKPGAKNGLLNWNSALREMKKIKVVEKNC